MDEGEMEVDIAYKEERGEPSTSKYSNEIR